MDIKLILSVLASLITIFAYYPYIRDIFKGKTKPHSITWLIWLITTGVATLGIWQGGGYFSAISMSILTLLVAFVFLLSFKNKTTNITVSDLLILFLSFLSIFLWWKANNPVLAILLISLIDGLGYIPTFRKSFHSPYEETLIFWIAMFIAHIFILLSNEQYNLLTVPYVLTVILASSILIGILIFRRKIIKNKSS